MVFLLSRKPEFKDFADAVFECLKKHGVLLRDLYIYPVTGGYRVEVYGELGGDVLESVRECVSRSTGFEVLAMVERGYFKLLAKKPKS